VTGWRRSRDRRSYFFFATLPDDLTGAAAVFRAVRDVVDNELDAALVGVFTAAPWGPLV